MCISLDLIAALKSKCVFSPLSFVSIDTQTCLSVYVFETNPPLTVRETWMEAREQNLQKGGFTDGVDDG